jgi:Uma2 family endonuclease
MLLPDQQFYRVEEYLWEEQRSPVKREFHKGQVYAMSGSSLNHSLIAVNLTSELRTLLRGSGCRAFNSDLKVAVPGKPRPKGRKRQEGEEFITYPDAGIICGQAEYYKGDNYTIANPVALFEVLSPSTRVYDHNTKAEEYKKIPGLDYYIMIDSERVRVELRQRGDNDSWVEATPLENLSDSLKLNVSRDITLSLAALYEGIIFEDAEEE